MMKGYTGKRIYHRDTVQKVWQPQGGEPGEVGKVLAVVARQLGIYALMGVPPEVTDEVYLTLIVKE